MNYEVEAMASVVMVYEKGRKFEVNEKELQALSSKVRKVREVRTGDEDKPGGKSPGRKEEG